MMKALSKTEGRWFHRGKEARSLSATRRLFDGRVSAGNRAAWNAGWDEQDRWMRPEIAEAEIAEASRVLGRLKAEVREMLFPGNIDKRPCPKS